MLTGVVRCEADPVWTDGNTLFEVIGYDLKAHEMKQELTTYQASAVCMLLGYLRGIAECSAVAAHYDATSLPFFLPDNITGEDMEKAVYTFLLDNPDKLKEKGDALVVAALAKEYPNPSFTPVTPKK
jgi:hypothetical protein